MSLEAGKSATDLAQPALASPRTRRVKPGNLKQSYLTRGLFGIRAVQMPDGCPRSSPTVGRCLTQTGIYAILAWIQAGAL